MSAAAADAESAGVEPPAKRGKKKLMLIIVVVLLALLLGAGAALMIMKKKAAHDDGDGASDDAAPAAHAAAKPDPAHPPTFLPLEPFVVNLADHDADRYAQVGIVLEVDNPVFGEQMKAYMPAIRNAILLILANKSSHDLLDRTGKERLAAEIQREVVRPMGIDIPAPPPTAAVDKPPAAPAADGDGEEPHREPARNAKGPHNPVRHVHFSNFIIQ